MLLELRIQNFAVIDQLALRLNPGLNALTGETGAGKSIIVGALSLLLGERASADSIRAGAAKAVVEGVFDVGLRKDIKRVLAEQGIETDEGLVVLRRELSAEGRSRAWINGAASTATMLGELGRMLVDLHGQHEHQTLLRRDEQRAILDDYAGVTEVVADVGMLHGRVRELETELAELDRRAQEAAQRADNLRFISNEIEAARVRIGEEEEMAAEAVRLEHAEELSNLARELHDALYAAETSVTSRLGELRRTIEHLVRIDPTESEARELLDNAYYALEELGQRMGAYADSIEYDPARLEEMRQRQDLLFRLKSKYGPAIEDVVATREKARVELGYYENVDVTRQQLDSTLASARVELERRASTLSIERKKAGARLEKQVAALLPDLGMASGTFEVGLEQLPQISATGAEAVDFRISLNAGFQPRILSRIASGGELSRVMLVLKTILARVDRVPTLVFDEIDAGIGGRVALQVGDKLRDVARNHQVFVITHLPQIASRATHHLQVEKSEQDGTTVTRVSELNGDERVRELARMLGGDPESSISLQHAKEMLQ